MKVCTRCKTEKPIDGFHRDRTRPDRHFPWCVECTNSSRRKGGPVGFQARPLANRLADLVQQGDKDECWPFTGRLEHNGYGRIAISSRPFRKAPAHRVAYELEYGTVPNELELDHVCRNRACCNPAHLEVVTHRENTLRGDTIPARNILKTHCSNGHPFDTENTRHYRGSRYCKTCVADAGRAYKIRKRKERLDARI